MNLVELTERSLARLARRRTLSVIVVGLLALSLRATRIPVLKIPVPGIHDEYSYLLAGDTFAHGRLTNPTPPLWQHFETEHVNVQPTYMSMYPPGQGFFLALGELLGHPWIGVLISCALMCAAICWMLQGWLPPGWALLGGILAALTLGTFSYWVNSYWGGAVAALGGALVVGALPRIRRRQRVRDAVLLAIGVAALANSRPYEGFVFVVPVAIALLAWMMGKKAPSLRVSLIRVVLPISAVLAITFAGMGYYFWRVSGS